jgi:hypothetical protein
LFLSSTGAGFDEQLLVLTFPVGIGNKNALYPSGMGGTELSSLILQWWTCVLCRHLNPQKFTSKREPCTLCGVWLTTKCQDGLICSRCAKMVTMGKLCVWRERDLGTLSFVLNFSVDLKPL